MSKVAKKIISVTQIVLLVFITIFLVAWIVLKHAKTDEILIFSVGNISENAKEQNLSVGILKAAMDFNSGRFKKTEIKIMETSADNWQTDFLQAQTDYDRIIFLQAEYFARAAALDADVLDAVDVGGSRNGAALDTARRDAARPDSGAMLFNFDTSALDESQLEDFAYEKMRSLLKTRSPHDQLYTNSPKTAPTRLTRSTARPHSTATKPKTLS